MSDRCAVYLCRKRATTSVLCRKHREDSERSPQGQAFRDEVRRIPYGRHGGHLSEWLALRRAERLDLMDLRKAATR